MECFIKYCRKHTPQDSWTPEYSHSLFAKVLNPDPEVIPNWERPESNVMDMRKAIRYGTKKKYGNPLLIIMSGSLVQLAQRVCGRRQNK